MKIKFKLLIYIIVLHLFLLALAIPLMHYGKYWLLAAELIVLISLIIAIRLFRLIYKPLEFSKIGAESLKSNDFNLKYILTGNYETDILINLYNNMIDKLREERIHSQEKNFLLEKLIEASPVGILILDFDGNITSSNSSANKLLNLDIENLKEINFNPLQNELLRNLLAAEVNQPQFITINGIRKYKCYKSHFIDRGFHRHFIILEELTNEILAAEKSAYGKVIRMMAHEVNNSVGAVNSLLDTIRFYKNDLPEEKQRDYLEAIKVAIDRNKNLGIFMSNFADVIRLPKQQLIEYDITILLRKCILLIKNYLPEKEIQFTDSGLENSFLLKIDPVQMEQVILNVLKNAIEAIDIQGKIDIKLLNKEKKLSICDNGTGISPESAKNLFTPFYSNKTHGQGIGLTLVRDILRNHGFQFSLQTKNDGLTYFEIFF